MTENQIRGINLGFSKEFVSRDMHLNFSSFEEGAGIL